MNFVQSVYWTRTYYFTFQFSFTVFTFFQNYLHFSCAILLFLPSQYHSFLFSNRAPSLIFSTFWPSNFPVLKWISWSSRLKTFWNIFSVCLSRSVESATEAISIALHSVSHALKVVFESHTPTNMRVPRGACQAMLYWKKIHVRRSENLSALRVGSGFRIRSVCVNI